MISQPKDKQVCYFPCSYPQVKMEFSVRVCGKRKGILLMEEAERTRGQLIETEVVTQWRAHWCQTPLPW